MKGAPILTSTESTVGYRVGGKTPSISVMLGARLWGSAYIDFSFLNDVCWESVWIKHCKRSVAKKNMASGWFRIDGVSHRNKQNIIQKIMSWWIWVWGIIHFASSSARCLIILIRQPKKLSGFFTSTNSWDVEAFSTRALLYFYWLIFFYVLGFISANIQHRKKFHESMN